MRGCRCTGVTLCPQCQALAERAFALPGAPPSTLAPPAISHKAFQAAIVRLAKQHGWKAQYTVNSRKSPSGWPDLVLARPGDGLVIAELKVGTDTLSPDQEDWLRILRAVPGIEAYVWHGPADWPQIDARLTQPQRSHP